MNGLCILNKVKLLFNSSILVRKDFFPGWRDNGVKSHFCFEVRLVEAWKNFIGLIGFKLGVEILLLIYIDETSAAISVIVVLILVRNSDGVFAFFELISWQSDEPFFLINFTDFQIQNHLGWVSSEVKMKFLWNLNKFKGYFCEAVIVIALLEVDVEVIGDGLLLNALGASLCSFLS